MVLRVLWFLAVWGLVSRDRFDGYVHQQAQKWADIEGVLPYISWTHNDICTYINILTTPAARRAVVISISYVAACFSLL